MKPSIHLKATVLATMAACSAASAQTIPEFKTKGIVGATARANLTLSREVGTAAQEAEAQKKRATPSDKDTAALLVQSRQLQEAVAAQMTQHLGSEVSRFVDDATAVLQFSELAVQNALERAAAQEAKQAMQVFEAARKANASTLAKALTADLADQETAVLQAWRQRLAAGNAAVVLEDIANAAKGGLTRSILDRARGPAGEKVREQLQSQLASALKTARSGLTEAAVAKLQQQAREGLPVLGSALQVFNAASRAQDDWHRAQEQLQAFGSVAEELGKLSDVAVARLSGGQMPPAEEAQALRTALFLSSQLLQGSPVSAQQVMVAVEKAKLADSLDAAKFKSSLAKLSSFSSPATFASGIGDVQGYVALVQGLGFNVDKNVTATLDYAQTAAGAVTALYTGNFMAATSGALSLLGVKGGMFGGASFDSDAAARKRHEQVMKELSVLREMMTQVLSKLDALQAQLAKATQQILTKLDGIEDSTNYLVELARTNELGEPLTKCRAFARPPLVADRTFDGRFTSYADRMAHLRLRDAEFQVCDRFLFEKAQLLDAGEAASVGPLFWDTNTARQRRSSPEQAESIWQYDRQTYFPMVAYTVQALGMGKPVQGDATQLQLRKSCATQFMAALVLAPRSMRQVKYDRQACSAQDAPGASSAGLHLQSVPGRRLEPEVLFGAPVHAPLISELAYHALNLHLYRPTLEQPFDLVNLPRIKDQSQLVKTRSLDLETTRKAVQRLQGVTDLVNIAIAQQTLLSGVYVSAQAAELLRRHGFGSATRTTELTFQEAAAGCNSHVRFEKNAYDVTACLLWRNPNFSENVLTHLVLQELRASKTFLFEYARFVDQGKGTPGDIAVTFPTLSSHLVQHERRWMLRLTSPILPPSQRLGADGKPLAERELLVALPSSGVVQQASVSYPAPLVELHLARTSLLEEMSSPGRSDVWTAVGVQPKSRYLPRIAALLPS